MIQICEDLHFIAESFANRFAAHARFDQLDCDLLAVMLVVAFREIHSAHPAVSNLAQDSVGADACACLRSRVLRGESQPGSGVRHAPFQNVLARIDSLRQQQIDFGAQIVIVRAR